ncbi:MAG TPA: hypothetical protein VL749_00330 [Patescibacteria group bacterium]|nr:hypothetical protein [Patescibacteria group bacterium]
MTAQLPTRITIELQPGEGAAAWTARTAVDDGGPAAIPQAVAPHAAEPREELPVPAAYEPAPCTCLDDGGCAADHAND